MSSNAAAADLHGQRVLVTGAAGQLGRYLVVAVRAAGGTLVATGSKAGAEIDIPTDLTFQDDVTRLVRLAAPDVVIHAAACTDVDGIERDPERGERGNALATANLAAAARDAGSYLLAVSTDMVFPGDGGAPYPEDAPTAPISAYGRSKLAAEFAVLASSSSFGVARTAWLYGGSGKHFPRTVLTVLRDRGGIDVVDDEAGSPTFAGDLAECLVTLAAMRAPGVMHVVNAGRATRFELARAAAELAGFDPELVRPISTKEFLNRYPLPAPRPPDSTLRNLTAAKRGVKPRHWREALAAYVPTLANDLGIRQS